MQLEAVAFGPAVAGILALDGNGARLMPLAGGKCSSVAARDLISARGAKELFPEARAPEAAVAGLYLYFSCWTEAHETAQAIGSADGSYWHAIVHRQEPDAANSTYWFRRVGRHPVFPALREEAERILLDHGGAGVRLGSTWDPYAFVEWTERARREPGSALESAALEIQRAEWQLLFLHCALPAGT
jgi:hypothetical protein